MNFSDIKQYNERLFWDGVCRKKISYSQAGALATGSAASSPLIEGFSGGPKSPVYSNFDPTGSISIGPGGTYPKPWRSASQFLQDGSYGSQIGPFARLVKIPENISMENTCVGDLPNCGGDGGGIYGRLGISDDGTLGFRSQDWYNQSEGTYDTTFWNGQLGTDWVTWKSWWDSASKATVTAKWMDPILPFNVEVEVAYDSLSPGDEGYFPAPSLNGVADASYDLLIAMVAIAAVTRWIL